MLSADGRIPQIGKDVDMTINIGFLRMFKPNLSHILGIGLFDDIRNLLNGLVGESCSSQELLDIGSNVWEADAETCRLRF